MSAATNDNDPEALGQPVAWWHLLNVIICVSI
jgi:hypothetical protein